MERTTVYMVLDEIAPADRNPKLHDLPEIRKSLRRFGYADTALLDERTGQLVGGHGRLEGLREIRDAGEEPPEHVVVDGDGRWTVPVQRGWSSRDDAEAAAAAIAFNRLTETGGWDSPLLLGMLDQFVDTDIGFDGIGFDSDAMDDLVAKLQEDADPHDPEGDEPESEYARKGVRSLDLGYGLSDFDQVAAHCARLRRARGMETNAELVKALVDEAVGAARAAEADA